MNRVIRRMLVAQVVFGSMMLGQVTDDQTALRPDLMKFQLRADIVLTPKFCGTKKRQSTGIWDVINVGGPTCESVYTALSPLFQELRRVDSTPPPGSAGNAQIILIPKFVEISTATQSYVPASPRKLLVLLEWTVQDPNGKKIWLETVQGTAEKRAFVITPRWLKEYVEAAVQELTAQSVLRISNARELRQFK